jgi:hypothetical protein
MLAGERTLYQVGPVNSQVENSLLKNPGEPNWKTVPEKTVSRVGEKGWMESWEENKEINQKQKKSFKEVKLKIIAIN